LRPVGNKFQLDFNGLSIGTANCRAAFLFCLLLASVAIQATAAPTGWPQKAKKTRPKT
jgi:hypothetical protein